MYLSKFIEQFMFESTYGLHLVQFSTHISILAEFMLLHIVWRDVGLSTTESSYLFEKISLSSSCGASPFLEQVMQKEHQSEKLPTCSENFLCFQSQSSVSKFLSKLFATCTEHTRQRIRLISSPHALSTSMVARPSQI